MTPIKAESILSRKPPIQPKPVVVATVPVQPAATPSPTILLQTVPGAQPQPLKPAITGTGHGAGPLLGAQQGRHWLARDWGTGGLVHVLDTD